MLEVCIVDNIELSVNRDRDSNADLNEKILTMVNLAEEKAGVLLYYYYIDLRSIQEQTAKWLKDTCSELGLIGRCRCAEDGLNCCLSGPISALLQHQEQLCHNFPGAREIVDFKLAEYPPLQPQDNNSNRNRVAKETGFDRLSVHICKEVVAFYGSRWEQVLLSNEAEIQPRGARHVDPIEFHNLLSQQQQQQQHLDTDRDTQGTPNNNAAVLLDMRNKYETRIGTFQIPNIDTIDPETRSFNEVPTWLESHKHQLVGKTVFMVCTGGVRCERASAHLLKMFSNYPKEEQPVDVVQLRGGIQRYLEAFPEVDAGGGGGGRGYFRGKNFYFDDRISVGVGGSSTSSSGGDTSVVGRCLGCRAPYDDYRERHRCVMCRMLILQCTKCAEDPEKEDMLCELCVERGRGDVGGREGERGGEGEGGGGREGGVHHIIDNADDNDNDATVATTIAATTTAMSKGSGNGKLKILVLHGFRQTGNGFIARNKDWMKKLSDIAEFTVIDAPHVLSYYYRKPTGEERKQQTYKRAWLVVPTDNNCCTTGGGSDGPGEDSTANNNCSSGGEETNMTTNNAAPTPTATPSLSIVPTSAPSYITNTQHLQQTEGWPLSHRVIQEAMSTGTTTYDGILGFSQGSGIAAAMCALYPDAFKFCICASGYMPSVNELQKVLVEKKPICMPSLHMYGSNSIISSGGTEKKQDTKSSRTKGGDADGPAFITSEDSHLLASMFDARQRCVLIHKGGHYIPGTRSVWEGMRKFLRGQQQL